MANEFRVKNGLIVGSLSVDSGGTLTIPDDIVHDGDTNNKIAFGTDTQSFQTGGTARFNISDSGLQIGSGARVTTINTSFSDNDTSLMTSQAIKEKIENYGYTTNTGDITGVDLTGGTGVTISSETGTTSGNYSSTIAIGQAVGTSDDVTFSTITIASDLIHSGDTNNKFTFGTDTQTFTTGGSSRVDISDSGFRLGGSGARVTTINTGFVDNDTSLMTSQAIKEKIESYGYTTVTGDITGVDLTGGASITISGETGTESGDYSATIDVTDNTIGAAELNVSGNGTSTQFLRSDGDGTFSWAVPSGSGASQLGELSDAVTGPTGDQAQRNVGLGENALDSITQFVSGIVTDGGIYNVAVGYDAGTAVTTGDNNTFVGYQAGAATTTGHSNVAIGQTALDAPDTEDYNIAIGRAALGGSIAGGEKNIAIGYTALDSLTISDNNVAIGHNAGTAITGGTGTNGSNNTLVGYQSGNVITTGENNVIIGADADPSANSGTNQIVIGKGATGLADNSVVLGNTDITAWLPPDDAGVDLGSSSYQFKDGYFHGTLEADAITLNGTALGSLYSPIAGSSSITTVGTIGTGTWNGSVIASAYLDSDTAHLSGTQTFSGSKTFSSKITADAGIDIDNFNIDGTTIALSSGDMTLDAAGDIILDADGADVILKDGGTEYGRFVRATSDFIIKSATNDKDIIFKGVDNSSTITALTLDMSEAGAATFGGGIADAGTISAGTWNGSVIGAAYLPDASETAQGVVEIATTAETTTGTATAKAVSPSGLTNGYQGSTNVTTLGTISTGTWSGTTIAVDKGGTGQTSYTNGQLLIGNTTGNTLTKATLTAGSGISITNGTGSITIAATGGGGGASAIGDLDDVLMDATNFVDGFLLQPESDGSAPTTGTLNSATGNIGLGVDVFNTLTEGDYNVGIGYQASDSLTTGSENVHIGYQAGQSNNTGAKNVFVGSGAGYSDPNGILGVAIGYRACFSGGLNYGVAVGGEANYSAGSNVTAVGYRAHKSHTGSFNVAIGREALDASGSGGYNVAIGGRHALGAVTSGARNIGIGYQAADGFDTESDNIAIGYDALGGSVAGGEKNVVIGNYAGDAVTSADNTVLVGYGAGGSLTSQSDVVGIGYEAGKTAGNQTIAIGTSSASIGTGWRNVMIGYGAGKRTTDHDNVVIGWEAGDDGTGYGQSVFIGSMAGKRWGIGDYNIAIGYGAGGQQDAASGNDAQYNTVIGHGSGDNVTDGDYNIFLGQSSGDNITTGSNNVVIGAADVPSATGDDQLSISSGDGGTTWITGDSSGNVSFNQLADVITASSGTTLTQAQSGSYVYWTGGTLTLPDGCAAGTQFTIFNNTGSSATVGLNTNGVINIGWASNAAVADNDATSYVCTSEAAGASYWVQVGA